MTASALPRRGLRVRSLMALVVLLAVALAGYRTFRRWDDYRRRANAWVAIHEQTRRLIDETRADAGRYRLAARSGRPDADELTRWAGAYHSRIAGMLAEDAQYVDLAARYRSAAHTPWRLAPPDPPLTPEVKSRLAWMTR